MFFNMYVSKHVVCEHFHSYIPRIEIPPLFLLDVLPSYDTLKLFCLYTHFCTRCRENVAHLACFCFRNLEPFKELQDRIRKSLRIISINFQVNLSRNFRCSSPSWLLSRNRGRSWWNLGPIKSRRSEAAAEEEERRDRLKVSSTT